MRRSFLMLAAAGMPTTQYIAALAAEPLNVHGPGGSMPTIKEAVVFSYLNYTVVAMTAGPTVH